MSIRPCGWECPIGWTGKYRKTNAAATSPALYPFRELYSLRQLVYSVKSGKHALEERGLLATLHRMYKLPAFVLRIRPILFSSRVHFLSARSVIRHVRGINKKTDF